MEKHNRRFFMVDRWTSRPARNPVGKKKSCVSLKAPKTTSPSLNLSPITSQLSIPILVCSSFILQIFFSIWCLVGGVERDPSSCPANFTKFIEAANCSLSSFTLFLVCFPFKTKNCCPFLVSRMRKRPVISVKYFGLSDVKFGDKVCLFVLFKKILGK